MAQFHVYRLAGGQLVLDLQSDLIDTGTRVVAPLFPLADGPRPIGRLEPLLDLAGAPHVLHMAEMAAIPSALLREELADLLACDYEVSTGLAMVFSAS